MNMSGRAARPPPPCAQRRIHGFDVLRTVAAKKVVVARSSKSAKGSEPASTGSSSNSSNSSNSSASNLMCWLKENGSPEQTGVDIATVELPNRRPLDMLVAKRDLKAGELILSVPGHLTITLDRVFESEFVAELLTTDKLSELACLTLYLMYEKKVGRTSFWYPFIKELDKQRARGPQAVESPLIWDEEELEDLLQGSPVVAAVQQRLAGIRKEYEALDTVWFMAGSLFKKYPFDLPTEAFSFELFRQAFAAVQASIVHLQGVSDVRRFCLVPLGPPLLSYSSTCKSLLAYDAARKAVVLTSDRDYAAGQPVFAWCGPQPNSRLLLNYGIVDEANPFDKLQMTVTIPSSDPLFQQKRSALQAVKLATQQTFDLSTPWTKPKPLPPLLLPYMRLAFATSAAELEKVVLEEGAPPADASLESLVASELAGYFQRRLDAYKHPQWKDIEIIQDPAASPRSKIAARLTKIEKSILMACQAQLAERYGKQVLEAAQHSSSHSIAGDDGSSSSNGSGNGNGHAGVHVNGGAAASGHSAAAVSAHAVKLS